ncbi:MAG: PKD domain-containing protein [Verrucomicrobiia bacterium]|jgi:PKD repeat protein
MKSSIRIASTVALAAIFGLANAGAIPAPPVANFLVSLTNGAAPLTVDFTDVSTGTITNWFWDFGDNTTMDMALPANPTHTYEIPGTYSVELVVSGPTGVSVNIQPDLITVIPEPSTFLLVSVGLCVCLAGKVSRIAHLR